MDYLISEAALRSGDMISFPRGFFTPKVGPHASYGFAPGRVFGAEATLGWGTTECSQPEVDSILATEVGGRHRFTILLNDSAREVTAVVRAAPGSATLISAQGERVQLTAESNMWRIPLTPWGLAVVETEVVAKGKK